MTSSSPGKRPVWALEKMDVPSTLTSKRPPLEGASRRDSTFCWNRERSSSANLAARGRYLQGTQYSMVMCILSAMAAPPNEKVSCDLFYHVS